MFGSTPNPGLRQPNQDERYLLHMPRHKNSMFVRNLCPPSSNCVHLHLPMPSLCPFGRAVWSSQTRKRGSTRILDLPRITVLHGLHGIYSFIFGHPHQFIWQIAPRSVRSDALRRGLRHPPVFFLAVCYKYSKQCLPKHFFSPFALL